MGLSVSNHSGFAGMIGGRLRAHVRLDRELNRTFVRSEDDELCPCALNNGRNILVLLACDLDLCVHGIRDEDHATAWRKPS